MKYIFAAILSLTALNNAHADGHGSAGGKGGSTGAHIVVRPAPETSLGHGTSGAALHERTEAGHGSSG